MKMNGTECLGVKNGKCLLDEVHTAKIDYN